MHAVRVGSGPFLVGFVQTNLIPAAATMVPASGAGRSGAALPQRISDEAALPLFRVPAGTEVVFEGRVIARLNQPGWARELRRRSDGSLRPMILMSGYPEEILRVDLDRRVRVDGPADRPAHQRLRGAVDDQPIQPHRHRQQHHVQAQRHEVVHRHLEPELRVRSAPLAPVTPAQQQVHEREQRDDAVREQHHHEHAAEHLHHHACRSIRPPRAWPGSARAAAHWPQNDERGRRAGVWPGSFARLLRAHRASPR